MTGPEHYREAERLAELAADGAQRLINAQPAPAVEIQSRAAYVDAVASLASVHATLALVAVNALPAVEAYIGNERGLWDEQREWTNVTAPARKAAVS